MDPGSYTPEPLSRARTIPSDWYTKPEALEVERAKIFGATWQLVGLANCVSEPGQYFPCEIAGEPAVIARAKDGVLRAFSNVCRHRASIVVHERGQGTALRCPYHGWTYGLDGKLAACPEFEGVQDWNKSEVALPAYRIETWGPFVFVNQDRDAPTLAEVFGKIPEEIAKLGCDIGRLHRSHRRDYEIRCNWKVYVDNYLEGYHLPAAHPGLFRELDYAKYRVDTYRYYSSQYAPIRPRRDGSTARRQYDYASSGPGALYYWIFPNFMLNVYPDNLSTNLILPLGPDRTLTIFEWFTYDGSDVRPDTVEFSDEIQQEDIRICESVQKGLASRTYDRGRFSVKRENGVHHFHLLLHEFLSRQVG